MGGADPAGSLPTTISVPPSSVLVNTTHLVPGSPLCLKTGSFLVHSNHSNSTHVASSWFGMHTCGRSGQ